MEDRSRSFIDVNKSFIGRPNYQDIAKITNYNKDLTPDESCDAVVKAIKL